MPSNYVVIYDTKYHLRTTYNQPYLTTQQQHYHMLCLPLYMKDFAALAVISTNLSDTCLTVLSRPRWSPPLQSSPGCWAICCVCGSFWAGCGAPGRWWGGSLGWCELAAACRSNSLRYGYDQIRRNMSCLEKWNCNEHITLHKATRYIQYMHISELMPLLC